MGDRLQLTFDFINTENIISSDPVSFSFSLIDLRDDTEIMLETSLTPGPLPAAFEGSFSVDSGGIYTGQLDGDFVDTFIIESAPSKGTLSLENSSTGLFTYNSDLDQEGTDSFSFYASNERGRSDITTITVTILNAYNTYRIQSGNDDTAGVPSGAICVDDDIEFYLDGEFLTEDPSPNRARCDFGPYDFQAEKGSILSFQAVDSYGECRGLSKIEVCRNDSCQVLTDGLDSICDGGAPGVVFDSGSIKLD